jgi:hypothetical protein
MEANMTTETAAEILPENSVERHCMMGNCGACNKQRATPALGGGATYTLWTDSHACTVIKISPNGKTVWLRQDKAVLLNGVNSEASDKLQFSPGGFVGHTSGHQRYQYSADPDGEVFKATMRVLRDGSIIWKRTGSATRSPGGTVYFGARHEHYDFNF